MRRWEREEGNVWVTDRSAADAGSHDVNPVLSILEMPAGGIRLDRPAQQTVNPSCTKSFLIQALAM
jgi:hypothetical protein